MHTYENPLITRYASKQMGELFSAYHRALIFRKLWLALAKAEKQLGLDITDNQIKDLEVNLTNIDFAAIEKAKVN
jgi:adenylosuccinate lyase